MMKCCKNCGRCNGSICKECFIYDKWKRQEELNKNREEKTKGIDENGKTR